MKEVTEAVLNGAGGSTDCMEILTGGCEYNFHNNRINKRLPNTVRTQSDYELQERIPALNTGQTRKIEQPNYGLIRCVCLRYMG